MLDIRHAELRYDADSMWVEKWGTASPVEGKGESGTEGRSATAEMNVNQSITRSICCD